MKAQRLPYFSFALALWLCPLNAQDRAPISLYDFPTLANSTFSLIEDSTTADTEAAAGRSFNFDVRLEFGSGTTEHEFAENDASGESDSRTVGFFFEGISNKGFGGGFQMEIIDSDDYDDSFIDDETSVVDLFGHFTYRFQSDRFRLSLRPGFGLHVHSFDDESSSNSIDYVTFFFRIQAEPELILIESRNVTWSVYGDLSLAVGSTEIDASLFVEDDDSSDASLFGVSLGTRVQLNSLLLGLGFVARSFEIDDTRNFASVENDYSGVEFTVGFRW